MSWDGEKEFAAEVSAITTHKPPVSQKKVSAVTKIAIRHPMVIILFIVKVANCFVSSQSYKNVVHHIEKFMTKVKPEYRLPCMFIIDSICRNAKIKLGEKDNFTPRFAKNIVSTVEKAFSSPKSDHDKIKRVVGLWAKSNLFSEEINESLFEICKTKTGSYPGIYH